MFFSTVTAATALLSLASASPLAIRDTATTAAKHTAPSGTGSFQLLALSTVGDFGLGGNWLTGFHTGAGESVAVAVNNQTLASAMHFNATTGDVYLLGGSPAYPYSLNFTDISPYMSNAPAGYKIVAQNVGVANAGISFDPANHNTMQIPYPYGTLALCAVNGTSPYFGAGPQIQLFTRAAGVKADNTKCSDVLLQAIFNHSG